MFNLSVQYLPEFNIVRVNTFGRYDLVANEQLVAAALAAGSEHGTTRFLVDHRNVELAFGILTLSDIPKKNEELGIKPNFRVALICRADRDVFEKFEFLENLSYVKGINRRVFTDEQTAFDWLNQDTVG
jgi:hypothetical protein